MRRLLVGLGSLVLLAIVVGAVFGYLHRDALQAGYEAAKLVVEREPEWASQLDTPEDVLRYIEAHRGDVALVGWEIADEGAAPPDGGALLLNPDEPMALASTQKIVVLGAYATAVEEGTLDPDEAVPLSDWDAWWLPGTDGGAHQTALAEGRFVASATLDEIAGAMIRYSDNAAADYLMSRLPDEVDAFIASQGLASHDPPVPFVGLMLSWKNVDRPDAAANLASLRQLRPEERRAEARAWARKWIRDGGWRERQLADMERGVAALPGIPEQMEAASLSTAASARDYAVLMARVSSGHDLAPGVRSRMRRHLEWPMQLADHAARFERLGAKGGAFAGLLTEAFYLHPKGGRPTVWVLFYRDMPLSAWIREAQTSARQLFVMELAQDPAFRSRVRDELRDGSAGRGARDDEPPEPGCLACGDG